MICFSNKLLSVIIVLTIFNYFSCTSSSEEIVNPPVILGPAELMHPNGSIHGWPDLIETFGPNINVDGTIIIRVSISKNGDIIRTEIIRGFGRHINESAIRTVKKLKFQPATMEGKPVDGSLSVKVIYQIK